MHTSEKRLTSVRFFEGVSVRADVHNAFVFFQWCALPQADRDRGEPENKAFKSPLQAVMLGSKMEARFRMFIARTKASNRYASGRRRCRCFCFCLRCVCHSRLPPAIDTSIDSESRRCRVDVKAFNRYTNNERNKEMSMSLLLVSVGV